MGRECKDGTTGSQVADQNGQGRACAMACTWSLGDCMACLRQRQVKQRLQELRVDALGDRASGALAHAVSEQL